MSPLSGRTVGLVGALEAFPRRLASREVERQGGRLRRGASRGTTIAVFGRRLLRRPDPERIAREFDAARAACRRPTSENGFLRTLGLLKAETGGPHSGEAMIALSGLPARCFDLLALFDAFGTDREPFSFRDLILARKYAGLLAEGAAWDRIACAVHRVGDAGAVAALTLGVEAETIIARHGNWTGEIDGQKTFALDTEGPDADSTFAAAEAAEEDGDWLAAAALYDRCLAFDPADSIAAFNRANCLRAAGRPADAAHDYLRAIKLDPIFVEARFNLAGLMAEAGHAASARRHLGRAIEIDGSYADAMFNLARLEYEAGCLDAAERWWRRYLQHDREGPWAQRARNGLRLIALQTGAVSGTG